MNAQAAFDHRTGHDDDTVRLLKKLGIPVTRENYLHLAYAGTPPEPWTAEHEASLPPALRQRD
jgi:hypothetical protein